MKFTDLFSNKNIAEIVHDELVKRDLQTKLDVYKTLVQQLKDGEFESLGDLIESLDEYIRCANC